MGWENVKNLFSNAINVCAPHGDDLSVGACVAGRLILGKDNPPATVVAAAPHTATAPVVTFHRDIPAADKPAPVSILNQGQ